MTAKKKEAWKYTCRGDYGDEIASGVVDQKLLKFAEGEEFGFLSQKVEFVATQIAHDVFNETGEEYITVELTHPRKVSTRKTEQCTWVFDMQMSVKAVCYIRDVTKKGFTDGYRELANAY